MKHFSYNVNDLRGLQVILNSTEICFQSKNVKSILVQIYCADFNSDWIEALSRTIKKSLTQAIVVGATTVGEITDGQTLTGQTVIGFSFFNHAQLSSIALNCKSLQEIELGNSISEYTAIVNQRFGDVKAILLLSTPLTLNISDLFYGIKLINDDIIVFGGGAGDYSAINNTFVFNDTVFFSQGCVVVVFAGENLDITSSNYLGWQPLNKSMTITGLDGLWVTHIDNKPAYDVYKTYLDIVDDSNFFIHAIEFPLLFMRSHQIIARVPVAVDERGALQFIADIRLNENFCLGYGDPNSILSQSKTIQQHMHHFAPEAIFIYSCGCRRFLMQEDVELETLPFQEIAPSFGFYTFGEYSGSATKLELLNSALVVVGFREGFATNQNTNNKTIALEKNILYDNSHARIVSRLVRFISAVTDESDQVDNQLKMEMQDINDFIWVLNMNSRALVSKYGKSLDLTSRDIKVMALLLESPGKVISRQQLATVLEISLFNHSEYIINTTMYRLRQKLSKFDDKFTIFTWRRAGYSFLGPVIKVKQSVQKR
jgi:DNA-binding winged helix-turn-helix (wHTH) protein